MHRGDRFAKFARSKADFRTLVTLPRCQRIPAIHNDDPTGGAPNFIV